MLKKILNWFKSEAENYAEDTKVINFPLDKAKKRPQVRKATTRKEKDMPLVKSAKPAAFKKNVATEVKAGKPVKQAVAISYAVKKEATKTKSKKK